MVRLFCFLYPAHLRTRVLSFGNHAAHMIGKSILRELVRS